jgi:hypothetical protein
MSDEPDHLHTASENTPLLADSRPNGHGDPATTPQQSRSKASLWRRRWPTILGLVVLCTLTVLIMLLGFFVPDAMQQYAIEATTVDVKSVVPEFTDSGARVRVQASVSLQSSRVRSSTTRKLGVFGTWIAREVETTGESRVAVTLPEYGDAILGTAVVPPLKVTVVDGRSTHLNFTTDLIPPVSIDPLRGLFDDWVKGRLDHVKVAGNVRVALRSGFLRFPSNEIYQALKISGMIQHTN